VTSSIDESDNISDNFFASIVILVPMLSPEKDVLNVSLLQ